MKKPPGQKPKMMYKPRNTKARASYLTQKIDHEREERAKSTMQTHRLVFDNQNLKDDISNKEELGSSDD